MVRFNFIVIICIIFLSGKLFPQRYPDHVVDSLLEAGIKENINQNYSGAKSTFKKLEIKYPGNPLGKIFEATVYVTKAFDYCDPFETDSIEYYVSTAKKEAEKLVEENDKNVWNIYSLALAEGFYSYFQALKDNWISAFSNGLNSINDFKKCLKLDPDFYEAYTAIGTYIYWRSRKTQIFNWHPFFTNGEGEGIKYLKLAVDDATYTRYFALNSLIWIYIDQKKYAEAEKLAESALKKFPDNRQFKLELARSLEESDPGKAVEIYFDVLNSYSKIKNLNRCNEIRLKHIIAQQYYKIGKYNEALKLCNEILGIKNLTVFEKEKLDKRLERVKKLKDNLLTELSK